MVITSRVRTQTAAIGKAEWVKQFAAELVDFGWGQKWAQYYAEEEYPGDPNYPVGLAVGEFLCQLSDDAE